MLVDLGRILWLHDGLERKFFGCWGGWLPRVVNTRKRRLSHYLPHHNQIMAPVYHSVAAPSVTIITAMS